MRNIVHTSAKPSHYNKEATHYDAFNHTNTLPINQFIAKTLKRYGVKSVLDLTCGTGAQVFELIKQGFKVVGVDINSKMLKIARTKAKENHLNIKLFKGDMRTTRAGEFDAVITIFNSIGHLTTEDFKQTIQNIYLNLKPGGIYIFDIFNLTYLLKDDNITKLTIDWLKKTNNVTAREIQYSTISPDGILASYDIYHQQIENEQPKITKAFQTLQTYSNSQLKELLANNNFAVIQQSNIDGGIFYEETTERILTIAKKK